MINLKIIDGPSGVGQSFPLPAGTSLTVGRSEDCNIRLPSGGVSKKHCRITVLPGDRIEVEDLGSSNGTFVNGLMIKKHRAKAGDTIGVHSYAMKVGLQAPQPVNTPRLQVESIDSLNLDAPGGQALGRIQNDEPEEDLGFAGKVSRWLGSNIYPLADSLSERFGVRSLVLIFFLAWSTVLVFLTAGPFTTQANDRVREESIGVARLYARQLVRLNQQAVIDQNYAGLLASLDARRGDTTGLIRSYILDANKAQVLAPAELLGQAFSQFEIPEIAQAASLAIAQDKEHVQRGSDGVAFVSAPIRVRVGEENKTVATAFVVYSYLNNQFTVAELTSRVVTSLLLAFVFCFVLIFFAYRWTEGSLQRVASSIDEALKKNEAHLRSPVDWPPLVELCEQVSFALGRSSSGSGGLDNKANFGGTSEWATQFVNLNGVAAFALNGNQQVTAWNPKLERILGVRSSLAIGQDFTQVSPDVSLESSVKQGLEQSRRDPGSMFRGSVELNGVNHALAVVSHSGSSLVSLIPAEEG